jgi:hypothetical protein
MGMGRFKALQLLHLIPTKRFDLDYILRLAEGMAESDVYLEFLRIRDHSQLTERQPRRQQFLYWVEWLKSSKQKRLIMNSQARGRKRAFRRIREIMYKQKADSPH